MLWKLALLVSLASFAWAEDVGASRSPAQPAPESPTSVLVEVQPGSPTNLEVQPPPRSPFAGLVRRVEAKTATPRSTQSTTKSSAQQVQKPGVRPVVAVAPRPAAPAAKPAEAATPAATPAAHGRDPFVSAIQAEAAEPVCTGGGKRCLAIGKLRLQGLVRSGAGYIAVVVNPANRAYFLRENDPLMNGYVVRITKDAVTFREQGKDRLGRPTSRDVTRTLSGQQQG